MTDIRRRSQRITEDVFAAVLRGFIASAKFDALAPRTKTNYRYLLGRAERPDTLGNLAVDVIRPAFSAGVPRRSR